ncbi:hypothetical protein EG68_09532 [Paragonimus skrjabini miyazakii]|uniref:Integrator complex subunit 4 n=1 Tax=Paragonimus skrjabini miyazakii TaxID=59628 RepID=A0A8S9Y8M2_9TREM|nr:hypothetical protein EG68_09532 [Paragonimus skrjabini miyazakii]
MLTNESCKPFVSSSHAPSSYHLEEDLLRRLQKQILSSSCFCSEDACVANEAFGSLSAHVRAKCIDLLAARAGPKFWLRAGYAGDLVLWHTDDGDARVRERAFACLRVWLSPSTEKMAVTQPLTNQQALLHQERLSWSKSNLDAIYYAACRGLSDVELVTRHTSLLLLAQLSTTWPRYELTDPPAVGPASISISKISTDPIYLIDDAFARVCTRLHDPGRQVRQLAAQLLSDLAKSVSDDYLIRTLEKTVMSDRQVRHSTLDRGPILLPTNQKRSDPLTVSNRSNSVGSVGIMSAGLSGAIISGLEDDFFEVRCATLSTVTHVASLSTRFASNCQDLLVDMLTDDIQEVRLAAVRALGAVGDQMPLQSEQVAIITSALAEGSGRIRRRLHQLLSRCRLASAPCLISLLDGLLRNLRRYPQDRDSLWRCAASVGRRHPVFVETCLSSLLRTHSWLSGPEPNREDPAYLTVLLLVLNAEPGAPGMPAKFPRHLAATKTYLRELVPNLLPKTVRPIDSDSDELAIPMTKRARLDSLEDVANNTAANSLCHFLIKIIKRLINLSLGFRDWLSLVSTGSKPSPESSGVGLSHTCFPHETLIRQKLSLYSRLVFTDLRTSVQRLDRVGQLDGLVQWVILLAASGWCLLSVVLESISRPALLSHGLKSVSLDNPSQTVPSTGCQPSRLLTKALHMVLRAQHLFIGKTAVESDLVLTLAEQVLCLIKTVRLEGCCNPTLVSRSFDAITSLLMVLINDSESSSTTPKHLFADSPDSYDSSLALLASAKRLFPVCVILVQPSTVGSSMTSDVAPGYPRIPAIISTKLNDEVDEGGWEIPNRIAQSCQPTVTTTNAIPEVRFTATMATVSIRIRAIMIGVKLDEAREHVCVLFRRPDHLHTDRSGNSPATGLHKWWPPSSSWHLLDDDLTNTHDESSQSALTSGVDRIELRAHLELSAGRWSDAGTVEIGLGYCVDSPFERSAQSNMSTGLNLTFGSLLSNQKSFVLFLTPRLLFAKCRLIPCAPVSQW